MPQITLPIEFPALDLSSALPIAALVILGALILVTLTARSLIQSRALAIVALAAILIGGSASIVGGLQAIALLIGVAGAVSIGLIIVLGRTPDVTDLIHTVVSKRDTTPQFPPVVQGKSIEARQVYQLPAAGQTARRTARRTSAKIPRGWL